MSVSPPMVSSSTGANTTCRVTSPVTFSTPPSSTLIPVSSVNFTIVPGVTVSVTPLGTTTQLRTTCNTSLLHVAFPVSRPSSTRNPAPFSVATWMEFVSSCNVCQPSGSCVVSHTVQDAPSLDPTFSTPRASRPPKLVRMSIRTASEEADAMPSPSIINSESTSDTVPVSRVTFMPRTATIFTLNHSFVSYSESSTSGIWMNFVPSPTPVQLSVPEASA